MTIITDLYNLIIKNRKVSISLLIILPKEIMNNIKV